MARRKPDTPEFTLFPRVVPEQYTGNLRVKGEYRHTQLVPDKQYTFELSSMRWRADSPRKKGVLSGEVTADKYGILSIPFAPDIRGEWLLTIDAEESKNRHLPAVMGAFVLEREYYNLRPYIGELHSHSTGSDGRQEPIYTAIRARQLGFDFLALTDHRNYHTSAELIDTADEFLGNGMLLMNGEEMHPDVGVDEQDPGRSHMYHFVAAGHGQSIRDLFIDGGDKTRAEVDAIIHELKAKETVPDLDVQFYAESIWKIRKAKELGGISIFCHPYWAWSLNIDEGDREQTFLDAEFDAVEVFTTADPSNIMANRYHSAADSGSGFAAVGVSDGHHWGPGTTLRQCTFVLAESLTAKGIVDAIKSRRSLGCEEIQNSDGIPRIIGPVEFIDFAEFYFLRILPIKRRIMAIEAETAFSGLRGSAYSKELVADLNQELQKLEKDLWA